MPNVLEQLKFIYRGGHLKRFHGRDTVREQNIAAHSFGVAWLVALQYVEHGVGPRVQVIMAALAHDLAEHISGDLPGNTKERIPELKLLMDKLEAEELAAAGIEFRLTPDEAHILKLADVMEGLMFCVREKQSGSKACDKVYETYWGFAMKMGTGMPLSPRQIELLAAIRELYYGDTYFEG